MRFGVVDAKKALSGRYFMRVPSTSYVLAGKLEGYAEKADELSGCLLLVITHV